MSLKEMFTTKNVGTTDRFVRALPLVIVGTLYFTGYLPLGWTISLGIFSAMLLLTSLMGVCSVYYLLGYSTCSVSGKPAPTQKSGLGND